MTFERSHGKFWVHICVSLKRWALEFCLRLGPLLRWRKRQQLTHWQIKRNRVCVSAWNLIFLSHQLMITAKQNFLEVFVCSLLSCSWTAKSSMLCTGPGCSYRGQKKKKVGKEKHPAPVCLFQHSIRNPQHTFQTIAEAKTWHVLPQVWKFFETIEIIFL